MNLLQRIIQEALKQNSTCAVSYRTVDLTSTDYATPTKPFRGVILAEAGDVEVVGLDGVSCVLPLQAGLNGGIGGIGINAAGTDATSLIAIY